METVERIIAKHKKKKIIIGIMNEYIEAVKEFCKNPSFITAFKCDMIKARLISVVKIPLPPKSRDKGQVITVNVNKDKIFKIVDDGIKSGKIKERCVK